MRNLKKFLALVLAMIMVVSASAVVSADFTDVAAEDRYAEAINDLAVKGIVKGTTDTTFGPTENVKRWQMALFVARAMSGVVESDADWANGHVQYVDVTEYKGAIEYVNTRGVINGWNDAVTGEPVFGPNDGITYVQALKMAVCALGYTEQLDWPYGYYNKAATLGLTANLVVDSIDSALTRAEVAQVIYNMIYAAPANGGLTFAEANFSVKTPDNTTMFVVVATPKQYYAKTADGLTGNRPEYDSTSDVEGTWVGIQPLVNGVANGQIIYLPCEQLGIAVAEVEDYFNRTVELINYDEKTGDFTDVELGKAPVIVNYTDIALDLVNNKIKCGGTTYTPSKSITGATLINELVIYEGAESATDAKVLPTDADGNIINGKGEIVASVLYTNANGTKWYFDETNSYALSEEEALEEWGIFVKDEAAAFVKYNTINATALDNKAYQLEMYDDNGDGDYERAVVRYIYMGVYYTELCEIDDAEREADGMLLDLGYTRNAKTVEYVYADGVENKAQENGAISVYTFNPQRDRVTVLAVLEAQTGALTKIDAKKFSSFAGNTSNTIKLTFDGTTTLTLGYDMTVPAGEEPEDYSIDGAQLGAELRANSHKGVNDTVADVTEEAFLEYYFESKNDLKAFVDTLIVDETYTFYAYNGYILMIDEVIEDVVFNIAVMEEFVDFDFGEVYVDMYVGTEFEEKALVTVIDGKDLSKLTNYKFSILISNQEYFYPGTIYDVDVVDGAYELNNEITAANYERYELLDAKVAAATEPVEGVGKIEFVNGSTKGADRTKRLRTNADTVFYFIDEAEDPMESTVTAYVGSGEDFTIDFDTDTLIWTDSLGTTNDKASVVYVINAADHDFFDKNFGSRWAFVDLDSEHTASTVTLEEALGNAAKDYAFYEEVDYLYEYTGNFYDMDNGEKFTTFYTVNRLENGGSTFYFLKIDENGIADNSTLTYWKTDDGDFNYFSVKRDYAAYGIYNVNGSVSSAAHPNWGMYWDDNHDDETTAESANYFDWLYYHKMNIDVEGKLDVPNSIMEVALAEELFEAEIDDGEVIIWDIKAQEYICDEDDDVTDIKVIDFGTKKAYTGEAAIEYLTSSILINYVIDPSYLEDGEIVFIVANTYSDIA